MKVVQTSDYVIFFDNVRVDPYIVNWNTQLGLSPGQASGGVTMFLSPAMRKWKAYLTQVRIFARNVFTGKYTMVFEGEIPSRNWNDQRGDSGKVAFPLVGFYHWLEIPIPLHIGTDDKMKPLERFQFEAEGINYRALSQIFINEGELSMEDRTIQEVVDYLFDKLNQGYYDASGNDSSFAWAKLKDRIKVMADIIKEFRTGGLFDIFTLINKTQIQTFYVYLNQILSQMMFEFYQDRDGAMRIKNPSWRDQILKSHILDESVIESISGTDGWDQEPTRILVVGGVDQLHENDQNNINDYIRTDITPVGLYVADAQKGHYYDGSTNFETLRTKYGVDGSDILSLSEGEISTSDWFDNVTGTYTVTSPFTGDQARTDVSGNTAPHRGTDYGIPFATQLRNIGTSGTVTAIVSQPSGGGNILEITEMIGGTEYLFKYMHLFKTLVKQGDDVKPGTPIAISGGKPGTPGAGNATGPHLHLEIWNMSENKPIDPNAFLRQAKDEIVSQELVKKTENVDAPAAAGTQLPDEIEAIRGSFGSLTSAASRAGVDLELAKAYIATRYAADTRDTTTKDLDFQTFDYLKQQISFLSGYDRTDDRLEGIITLNDNADIATQTMQLLQKMEDDLLQFAPSSDDKAYNAFSSTDNVKQSDARKFSVFKNPLETLKASSQPKSAITAATDWMDFEATAYIATCPGCTGKTYAGGFDVTDTTKNYHIIAVDPTVIPLWSKVEIRGPGGISGTYDALDIGGAIKGRHIDILMNSYDEAITFGHQDIKLRIIRSGQGKENIQTPRSMAYASTNELIYPVPAQGTQFTDFIKANPGGIDPNLICSIIDVQSRWQPKYGTDFIGLMGLPKAFADSLAAVDATLNFKDGNVSIEQGSKFLAHCMDVFSNQVTVALAAYYTGDPVAIDGIARQNAKTFNFVKLRSFLPPQTVQFVDNVLNVYLTLFQADYIQGDPNKDFGLTSTSSGAFVDDQTVTTPSPFSDKFGIGLSNEELRFKMNLQIFTQQLIRYGTKTVGENRRNVQEIIQRYAQYMMQVYRAAAHVVQIQTAVCMPFLRPGFNTWVEPSRSNIVAYITSVSHQGTFSQGCFTTVSTEFVRTASTYDDIQETVFLGEMHAKASDFGTVVPKEEMDKLRDRLVQFNEDDAAEDASSLDILRELYNADNASDSEYVTEWNAEYTIDEIEAKIAAMYQGAPSVVKQRTSELAQVISESEDFFTQKLLVEFEK